MAVAGSEVVVYSQLEACPYLPHRTSRLPMRYPLASLTPAEFDKCLANGDRRSGGYLYRASCPTCSACEAIRLDVNRFQPDRTQRRIERRGSRLFTVTLCEPTVDAERVRLFNLHRESRGLARSEDSIDEHAYRAFLGETCCETLEIDYRLDGGLVCVAICDRAQTSLSAVYCYYDVGVSHWSPGVFSILTQVRLCREWRLRHLYLGYYVADSPHMSYKARYLPHERRIRGRWQSFDRV